MERATVLAEIIANDTKILEKNQRIITSLSEEHVFAKSKKEEKPSMFGSWDSSKAKKAAEAKRIEEARAAQIAENENLRSELAKLEERNEELKKQLANWTKQMQVIEGLMKRCHNAGGCKRIRPEVKRSLIFSPRDNVISDTDLRKDVGQLFIDPSENIARTRSNSSESSESNRSSKTFDKFKNGMVDLNDSELELCIAGNFDFYEYFAKVVANEGEDGLLKFKDQGQYEKFKTLLNRKQEVFERHKAKKLSNLSKLEKELTVQKKELESVIRQRMITTAAIFPKKAAELDEAIVAKEQLIAKDENIQKNFDQDLKKMNSKLLTIGRFIYKCDGGLDHGEGVCMRFEPLKQQKEEQQGQSDKSTGSGSRKKRFFRINMGKINR